MELPITDITPEDREIKELVELFIADIDETQPVSNKECSTQIVQHITITNAIEPKMLEYKHWTGKYSPELFTLSVNGLEVEQGKSCNVPADASTVEIAYTYSFMNGMRTGGKKISYQLNENITQADITFDWKDDWRVIINNGKAIKEIIS